jgi:glyoxylase-like metal-dependent hydrolase (beta-lactamase superfamily II)
MAELTFDRSFDAVPGRSERLSPLIRRVLCANPGPFTFKGTSSFIVGTGKVAIVDPGPDDDAHLAALLDAVRNETVTHILVTHTHRDHSPLAAKLQRATGAATVGFGPHGGGAAGGVAMDVSADTDFTPDLRAADRDTISGEGWTLSAIHTPGHTSNHLCFSLGEEKTLLAGDHVMAWSTSIVAPPDGDMGAYMASLQKLLARDDLIYHPAHGPSRRDPLPLVRAYLAHRRMREAAIAARLKAGDRTIPELVKNIYAGLDPKLHAAAGLSVLAHLSHLEQQGRVRADGNQFVLSPGGESALTPSSAR